jgi:Zn-finger nucleic acid-binding protein
MATRSIDSTHSIEACDGCGGTYLEAHLLDLLITDVQRGRDVEWFSQLGANTEGRVRTQAEHGAYVKCPECRTIMNRRQFSHGSLIIVDGCKGHGTFFDAGEITKLVAFIQSGGLVRAAELEKQRQLDRQHELKQAKRRADAIANARVSANLDRDFHARGSSGITEFLLSLFW